MRVLEGRIQGRPSQLRTAVVENVLYDSWCRAFWFKHRFFPLHSQKEVPSENPLNSANFRFMGCSHLRAFFSQQRENQDLVEFFHRVNGISVRVCECIHTWEKSIVVSCSCEENTHKCENTISGRCSDHVRINLDPPVESRSFKQKLKLLKSLSWLEKEMIHHHECSVTLLYWICRNESMATTKVEGPPLMDQTSFCPNKKQF